MHDRFEKEVQKKMEELNVTPSAPVWEKIELEIRPEKTRRRLILWLFFGLLLAGGGFLATHFIGSDSSSVSSHPSMPANTKKENKTSLVPETSSSPLNTPSAPVDKDDLTTTQIRQTNKTVTESAPRVMEFEPGKRNAKLKYRNLVLQNKNRQPQEKPVLKPTEVITSSSEVKDNAVPMPNKTEQKQAVTTNDSTLVAKEAPGSKDSVAREPWKETELSKPSTDSVQKRKVASSRKWKKQITAGAGWSNYADGVLTSSMMMSSGFQSPTNSGTNGVPVFYRPSGTKSGLAFMLGASLSKRVSNHVELSAGLQYAHYSTKTPVGNNRRNDTTIRYASAGILVSQYYQNAGSNEYVNRFHVIEVPVSVIYQPSLKLPLYISLGAAYGRLISTNALTFSNTANVYYPNNDNYVRNMLPASASVQVELFSKKKVSLRIGPSVQYNLLKLRKENIDSEPHLFFAGIKTAVNF
ncbi:MAG TPA: hypothetical protein VER36_05115 [Flavisolibacter sp.]|nr:hypothetical protein [Flavisolibacter sp.]